ncbi:MAG TPA: response regulator [Candidatus Baltobacteraceae bacterium]|nr:response regulator [Candidatus Baltobacteraceae bacterium]
MKRLRVLTGDDDPMVTEGLRAMLERLGHGVAGAAHDGMGAVARAESMNPDLILLDIKMPRLDGVEAARQIMAHRPVPIILVTAHSDPDLIERAMAAGVMGYLMKPVEIKALEAAIALALSRFTDLASLQKDVQGLKETLVFRQQVERAKGVLAYRLRMSEAAAHEKLQHFARTERCTLAEAASRVIAGDKLFAELEKLP